MTVFSQNNPEWKNTKIGFDTGANDTIGNYGCYMTAIANVCSWAGTELNPSQVNDACKQHGWLVSSDLIGRDDIPALLCNNLQFDGRTNWNDAVSMNFFADASSPEVAYIICIDASHAPGIQTHFVMVWATLGADDLEIEDSWDGIRKPLSHYGNPSIIIQSATKFTKTVAQVPQIVEVAQPVPEPVVAPAPTPLPDGAVVYPSPSETYTLVVDCPGYVTSNAAANHLGASSTVTMGDYAVFNKKLDGSTLLAINVTHTPGVAGSWINPLDNKVPEPPTPATVNNGWLGPRESGAAEVVAAPTTTPPPLQPVVRESQIPKKPSEVPIGTQADNTWKSGYKALNTQNRSEEYELVQPWTMKEYSGKKNPVPLADGTKLNITGTFIKNGVKFYRTRSARDEYFAWWYAVPALDDNSRAVIVKVPPQPPEPPDNYLSLQDVAYYLKSDLSKLKIWDVIRRKKVNK